MSRKIIGATVGTSMNPQTVVDKSRQAEQIKKNTEHTENTSIHVTASEKESWNSKQPAGNYALKSEIPNVPVKSVNGKTGAVQLGASDVGAEPSGTAETKVSEHNSNTSAHSDIRLLIEGLTSRLNALANSDDTTLDQMAEVVAYIKSNRTLIEGVTTNKVNVADIINNLTTNVSNKPLSAAQGVVLKGLIDTLQTTVNGIKVPTKVSELTNDSKYVTESGLTAKGYAKQTDVEKLSEEIADLKENGGSGTSAEVSWNDLKDKPFYSYALNEVVYSETVTLSTGSHKSYTNGVPFEIVKGETYKVTIEGETYEREGKTHTVVMDTGSLIYTYIGNLSIVNGVEGANNTEEPFVFASLSVGGNTVFVLYTTYPSSSTISVEVQHIEKIYSPLSHIYLPDGVPYLVGGTIPILENCVTVLDEEGMGYITAPVTLEAGKTYIVTYNGTEYECVAIEFVEDETHIVAIGNGEIIGLAGSNEPFALLNTQGMSILVALDGSTEATISILEKVAYKRKLPVELLPETVATKEDLANAIANIVNGNGVEY